MGEQPVSLERGLKQDIRQILSGINFLEAPGDMIVPIRETMWLVEWDDCLDVLVDVDKIMRLNKLDKLPVGQEDLEQVLEEALLAEKMKRPLEQKESVNYLVEVLELLAEELVEVPPLLADSHEINTKKANKKRREGLMIEQGSELLRNDGKMLMLNIKKLND